VNRRPAAGLAAAAVVLVAALAAAPAEARPAEPDEEAVAEPAEGAMEPSPELLAKAREILRRVPLVDGHNDAPWQYRQRVDNHVDAIDLAGGTADLDPPMHTDIPRLRAGGVGAQFWSVYIPVSLAGDGATATVLEQIDLVHRLSERYPETFETAYGPDDVRRIFAEGRIASLIGMEGGHAIENSLAVLRQLYRAGARYMTITHSDNTAWADSSTAAPEHSGLSPFGREVVREMNRLGMLVDLSHVSAEAMHDILDATEAPVIFSHSSARALTGHPRNVPDDVLERMPDNGGVVMVTFVEPFVSEGSRVWFAERDAMEARLEALHPGEPEAVEQGMDRWAEENPRPRATLSQVADHVDHVREVAGIDHVGIGSDFDGIGQGPVGLEDVSRFPALLAELLRRGYGEEDVAKVAGLNLLRAFDRVEEVAARLRTERPPSDALIGELDAPERDDSPAHEGRSD
jgi:membrane dipeptidase